MPDSDVILISRTDVARHAGVGRAAVTNWEKRYKDFPRSVRGEDRQLFDAVAVAAWLDGRKIPANMLLVGETDGLDYGTRFRQSLGLDSTTEPTPPSRLTSVGAKVAERLLDDLRDQIPSEQAIWLAILVYLRACHPEVWTDLKTRSYYENGWHLVEHAWQQTGNGSGSSHDIRMLDRAFGSISDRSWSVRSVVQLIDKAHEALEAEHGSTPGRAPSAELFVSLTEKYALAQGRRSQEFFTPRAIVELGVKLLSPCSTTLRIHDPFCRTGEFLSEAVSHLAHISHDLQQLYVSGQHPNRAVRSLAQMNLELLGVDAHIDAGYWWEDWETNGRYDMIFSNPPFNMHLREELIYRRQWRYGQPPAHNGNFAWLQYVVSLLSPGGHAAVVMPNNAGLSTNSRERTIRAAMIEDGAVECVIGLPARLFAGTGIPVSLWLLQQPSGTPHDVLFIDAMDLGTTIRSVRTLADEEIGRVVAIHARWRRGERVSEPGFARSISIEALRAGDHALNPAAHVEPHRSDINPSAQRGRVVELLRDSAVLRQRARHLEDEGGSLAALLDSSRTPQAPWRTVPLASLCVLKSGPSGSQLRYDVKPHDGVPVVLPKHLQNGLIAEPVSAAVPQEIARKLSAYRLEVDDLIIARTVEFGRVARVNASQRGWLFATGIIRLRTGDEILPSYLAHVLASPTSREWMTRHATGTVVPAITLTTLAKLPVSVPSLAEQERLSIALDAIAKQKRVYTDLARTSQSILDALTPMLFALPYRGEQTE